jgi:hypothetical protein
MEKTASEGSVRRRMKCTRFVRWLECYSARFAISSIGEGVSAEEGTRTPTAFRPPAPKAGASANSATSAAKSKYIIGARFPLVARNCQRCLSWRPVSCLICACRAGALFVSLRGTRPAGCDLMRGGTPCHIAQNAELLSQTTPGSVRIAERRKQPPGQPYHLLLSRTLRPLALQAWPKMSRGFFATPSAGSPA